MLPVRLANVTLSSPVSISVEQMGTNFPLEESLKIVCLSDTHELHRDVVVPDGDVLIHAGDITFFSQRPSVLEDFNAWLGEQPHEHKIVIPGNHDSLLQLEKWRRVITNAHLLINSGVEVASLKIWGSPVTPYANVAFGMPERADRIMLWSQIPAGLDILITHSPPYGVLDAAEGEAHHGGCRELRAAVVEKRPRLHVFGHVHSGYGATKSPKTTFVNAALLDELGGVDREPITLGMHPKSSSIDS